VTDLVKDKFSGKSVTYLGKYNLLFGDPVNKKVKTLKVIVRFKDGKVKEYHFLEDSPMDFKVM
ncbi:MAG: hypothetical protein IKX40_11365, partial [Thermoguttaceae bacterium]|nr:hypothetical protein [Thermoguttaceae bacterium]